MKKKDLIFYASAAVLLAFSTQQVKADEQTSSDQTSEKTATIVLKADTSSNTEKHIGTKLLKITLNLRNMLLKKRSKQNLHLPLCLQVSLPIEKKNIQVPQQVERFPLQKQKPVGHF